MRMILSYMKKYRGWIAAVMVIKMIGTICELSLPYVLEHMIDVVVPAQSRQGILLWGILMIILAVVCRTMNVTANRMSVKVAERSTYAIRRDLFEKTLHLSGDQADDFGLPSLTSRMTSDSYNVQSFIQQGQTLGVRAPMLLLGGICVTLCMDRGLAAILCIICPMLIVVVVGISFKGIPLYNRVQECLDGVVRIMRENISGIRVVKALSKEDYERRRFSEANNEMTSREVKASVIMSMPGPMMNLALNVGLTLVVVIGAGRVNRGVTQPGVILAFLTYFNIILMGVMSLNRFFMSMSKANASANRIDAVLKTGIGLPQIPESEAKTTEREGFIVFDHVDFSYRTFEGKSAETGLAGAASFAGSGREKCLSDIDFAIPKGGSLGIIGATGCGKTTIINLLMRFYDVDDGGVFVDGRDVRTYPIEELRRKFGVVFQNDVVFADTLKENIEFGRSVTEDGLRTAVEDAQAAEFTGKYEDGLKHHASIRGADMSGGQKQRILISRALAADPEILVLDDSSSALDYRTDAQLRKAIQKHHSATTMIVIAQRISSIMSLDQIIVMEEGRAIGCGTHAQLMESCPLYRQIYETQMGEGR